MQCVNVVNEQGSVVRGEMPDYEYQDFMVFTGITIDEKKYAE